MITQFVYKKQDVEEIYGLLDFNKNDIVKVFTMVWNRRFQDEVRENAPFVLALVEKTLLLMKLEGRNSDRIWNAMLKAAKPTFDPDDPFKEDLPPTP